MTIMYRDTTDVMLVGENIPLRCWLIRQVQTHTLQHLILPDAYVFLQQR